MGFCNSCGRPIVKEDYGTTQLSTKNIAKKIKSE